MPFVVASLLLAVTVGYATGGRISRLSSLHVRGLWLAPAAVAAQLLIGVTPSTAALPLLLLSQMLLLAFLLANRGQPGVALIALGIALNALVIDLNGAMPVSADALRMLGGEPAVDPGKHRLLQDGDRLAFLADVIPFPPLRTVLSIGDLVLAAGVAWLTAAGMRGGGRREEEDENSIRRGRGGRGSTR